MVSIAKNTYFKIKLHPVISCNRPGVNFLLFLIFVCFVTVGIDLVKDISFEKNEIELLTGILEESKHADFSPVLLFIRIGHLYNTLLPKSLIHFLSDERMLPSSGRSPPPRVQPRIFQISMNWC